MESSSDIQKLFRRYLANQYSREDLARILDHFQANENSFELKALIEQELLMPENEHEGESIDRIIANVDIGLERITNRHRDIWPMSRIWYSSAAAGICILLAAAASYFAYRMVYRKQRQIEIQQSDAVPGGNKATLTLANGSVISLNEAAKGLLVNESGVVISKTSEGQLRYDNSDNEANIPLAYNEVSTPKGGQYSIVLPDGTKVWLNAASRLRYPTRFALGQRKVTLVGEGYFEVAPSKHQPFIVESQNQEVEVLGTHFNVNSYTNENGIKTSLLEGSVKVTEHKNQASKLLKPGQQSVLTNGGIRINQTDVHGTVAWKEGLFRFDNTDIKALMRQLERWYDIEIDEDSLPDRKFNGEMSRDVQLSQVLKMIEVTSNLKFKLEGKRLIMVQ